MTAWEELRPEFRYSVYGEYVLDHSKEQALLHLYRPIMGPDALNLYLTFSGDILPEGKSDELLHSELLAALNIGLPQMYQARLLLEGLGLLKSYEEVTESGKVCSYLLMDPATPKEFFQDALLMNLLIAKVGEGKFRRLAERFQPSLPQLDNYQNKTKKFLDVYRINQQEFQANEEVIEKSQARFSTKATFQENDPEFDWGFFEKQLRFSLNSEERDQLNALQLIYGSNELELAQIVNQASQNELNLYEIRRTLAALAKGSSVRKKREQPLEYQELEKQGFSAGDIQTIMESQQIPPIEYLRAIKVQKGGYETKDEVYLIEDLVKRSGLPTSVVNILINYILVVSNQPTLNKNYINKIANEWAQLGIKTPVEAIQHVRSIAQQANQSVQKTGRKQNSRLVRREKLPDWVNKPPKEKTLSPEKQAELDEKLAAYLKKKAGDD